MDLLQSFKKYLDIRQIDYEVNDSTIFFSRNGWHFMFIYDRDAPSYFRLALPKISVVNDSFTREKMIQALQLSATYKVVKAVIIDNNLWLLFESFLPESESPSSKLFDRAIRGLIGAGQDWRSYNNEV